MRLEGNDHLVLVQISVPVKHLTGFVRTDVHVHRVAGHPDPNPARPVFRLVAHRMELESDLETGPGVPAVRMEMQRRRRDHGARIQDPTRIRIKDVLVSADLMNREPAALQEITGHARAIVQVVNDKPATHRLRTRAFLGNVINFPDFDG